jgi:hypothetical protein
MYNENNQSLGDPQNSTGNLLSQNIATNENFSSQDSQDDGQGPRIVRNDDAGQRSGNNDQGTGSNGPRTTFPPEVQKAADAISYDASRYPESKAKNIIYNRTPWISQPDNMTVGANNLYGFTPSLQNAAFYYCPDARIYFAEEANKNIFAMAPIIGIGMTNLQTTHVRGGGFAGAVDATLIGHQMGDLTLKYRTETKAINAKDMLYYADVNYDVANYQADMSSIALQLVFEILRHTVQYDGDFSQIIDANLVAPTNTNLQTETMNDLIYSANYLHPNQTGNGGGSGDVDDPQTRTFPLSGNDDFDTLKDRFSIVMAVSKSFYIGTMMEMGDYYPINEASTLEMRQFTRIPVTKLILKTPQLLFLWTAIHLQWPYNVSTIFHPVEIKDDETYEEVAAHIQNFTNNIYMPVQNFGPRGNWWQNILYIVTDVETSFLPNMQLQYNNNGLYATINWSQHDMYRFFQTDTGEFTNIDPANLNTGMVTWATNYDAYTAYNRFEAARTLLEFVDLQCSDETLIPMTMSFARLISFRATLATMNVDTPSVMTSSPKLTNSPYILRDNQDSAIEVLLAMSSFSTATFHIGDLDALHRYYFAYLNGEEDQYVYSLPGTILSINGWDFDVEFSYMSNYLKSTNSSLQITRTEWIGPTLKNATNETFAIWDYVWQRLNGTALINFPSYTNDTSFTEPKLLNWHNKVLQTFYGMACGPRRYFYSHTLNTGPLPGSYFQTRLPQLPAVSPMTRVSACQYWRSEIDYNEYSDYSILFWKQWAAIDQQRTYVDIPSEMSKNDENIMKMIRHLMNCQSGQRYISTAGVNDVLDLNGRDSHSAMRTNEYRRMGFYANGVLNVVDNNNPSENYTFSPIPLYCIPLWKSTRGLKYSYSPGEQGRWFKNKSRMVGSLSILEDGQGLDYQEYLATDGYADDYSNYFS